MRREDRKLREKTDLQQLYKNWEWKKSEKMKRENRLRTQDKIDREIRERKQSPKLEAKVGSENVTTMQREKGF